MTTVIATDSYAALEEDEIVLLQNISWDTYERLLEELGEQNLRLTYDNGDLAIMAPSLPHEVSKSILGRMLETISYELSIPIKSAGSTTWKKKAKRRGLEADESYYVQHESQMRSKEEVDLRRDPPPDLAIEVEVTHYPLDRLEIYASLKVPELWLYNVNTNRVRVVMLKNKKYVEVKESGAFPMIRATELEPFLAQVGKLDETSLMQKVGQWARRLSRPAPRRAAGARNGK
jgi:Uma2 family endonuclease